MPDSPRVRELLDELLESGRTPESVCAECPELLSDVRERWRQICDARAEFDALFPPFKEGAPEPPGAPPVVPGYDVTGVLGRGGMGIVYQARHRALNRLVALKTAAAWAAVGPDDRERFRREAEAVAGLRHPNVVPVYDYGEADGRPYFTMELVDGGSLAQKLAGNPQPPRDAAALVATIAGAVETAHRAGIVHRDLKPANVLLTADGVPKVTDFGLARRLGTDAGVSRPGGPIGTPSYMAPEQARGEAGAAGPAADVYALGAILYELLTGRLPFQGDTPVETVQQVLLRDPVPPSRVNLKVPRDLETICLKCLRKEPPARYGSAAELQEDLGRYLRGEAVVARPEGWVRRLVRKARRHLALTVVGAVGASALTALLAGGLLVWADRRETARRADADRAAVARAAAEDLSEAEEFLRASAWADARAATERAKVRSAGGPDDLLDRLGQCERDLALVARLESTRLHGFSRVGSVISFSPSDDEYEGAFRGAGFGAVFDDPAAVAARVRGSNIAPALVAALDNWSACAVDPRRRVWAADVARWAAPDPADWRTRLRAPAVWANEAAAAAAAGHALSGGASVPFLLAVEQVAPGSHPSHGAFLKVVQRAHPADFWVNLRLGFVLLTGDRAADAVRFLQAALALRPQTGLVHHYLGAALLRTNRVDEGLDHQRRAVDLDPEYPPGRSDLVVALWNHGCREEAFTQLPAALRLDPDNGRLHTLNGLWLEQAGRTADAVAEHRWAVALAPGMPELRAQLRQTLIRLGRYEEGCDVWKEEIARDPPNHGDRYGYAELALYLGRDEDYARERAALLRRYGRSTDLFVAERVARACLARPADGEELRQAAALAELAGRLERSRAGGAYPFFQFARGLADYRLSRYDAATAVMRGDAAGVLKPAPQIVLAMALVRSGHAVEGKKALVEAVRTHDWSPGKVRDQNDWILHALRREAEEMLTRLR